MNNVKSYYKYLIYNIMLCKYLIYNTPTDQFPVE